MFVFLVETGFHCLGQAGNFSFSFLLLSIFSRGVGFHHVGQAGLELLASSDPLASASQITILQA